MRKYLGPIIISVISILIMIALLPFIVVIELFLRAFAFAPDPYESLKTQRARNAVSAYPPNVRIRTQAEEGLSGVEGCNWFTTNNIGFRGDYLSLPKPVSEFRIFMVGASTLESYFLDDSHAVNSVLQDELNNHLGTAVKVKVYNTAKSWHNSMDHVAMIAHRIVHLEPDMIIVFTGINDVRLGARGYDYLQYDNVISPPSFSKALKMLATEFQIFRRLHNAVWRISGGPEQILRTGRLTGKSNYKEKVELRKSAPLVKTMPSADPAPYGDNLRTIVGVCDAHGIQLIFMTQQTTWNSQVDPNVGDWHWGLYNPTYNVAYPEDLADEAMESYNDVMRQVAAEYSIPVYDVAKSIPKSLDYFYDDCHFNVNGAYVAGKGLASLILDNNMISGSWFNGKGHGVI